MRFCDLIYILPPIILLCTANYPIHKHLLRRGAGATSVAACSTCLEGTYSNGTGAHMYLVLEMHEMFRDLNTDLKLDPNTAGLGWMIFIYNLHAHHRPELYCIF